MLVQGKNCVLRVTSGSALKLYACATECSLNINTATIETSTTGSGDWVTVIGQKKSWSATFSGVVSLDTTDLNLYNLRALQFAMTAVFIQIERTDTAGNSYISEGTGIITASSDTGNINDFATFSIDMQGTGAITDTLGGSFMMINENDHLLINSTDKLLL